MVNAPSPISGPLQGLPSCQTLFDQISMNFLAGLLRHPPLRKPLPIAHRLLR